MIDILTNAFLNNPVPLQFSGNYCSHGCSYCFANVNNPQRKLDVKGVASQLRNYKNNSDIASYYMQRQYPVLISNNIDPFSKSNQPFTTELIYQLQDIGIPVVLATRGGIGWEQLVKDLNKSVFYISIPYDTDGLRAMYEPQAPTIEHRWQLASEAKASGHDVIISINPLNKRFAENHLSIAERASELGVKTLLINKLHLTAIQQANLTQTQKDTIGADLLSEAKGKGFTDDFIDCAIDLHIFCIENNMQLIGFDSGLQNEYFCEWKACYKNLLPTQFDFFNWCADNKTEGDLIYFEEFYEFFKSLLPDVETNISKYIFNKAVIDNKSSYQKQTLRNLLHYYWQVKNIELGFAKYYPVFSWAMLDYGNKLDFYYDEEHNKVLVYTPENFTTKDFTLLKLQDYETSAN